MSFYKVFFTKKQIHHGFLLLLMLLGMLVMAVPSHAAWKSLSHSQAMLSGPYVDDSEQLYMAVDIKLETGWKIYWRESGDAGLSTQLTLASNEIEAAHMLWPYPKRDVVEQFGLRLESYVYEDKVTFPLKLTAKKGVQKILLDTKLEYGICKEICIPVQATFEREIDMTKEAEFSSVPLGFLSSIPKENGVNGVRIEKESVSLDTDGEKLSLTVALHLEEYVSDDVDMFIEGGGALLFTAPEIRHEDEKYYFEFDVTVNDDTVNLQELPLTITAVYDEKAVELKGVYSFDIALPVSQAKASSTKGKDGSLFDNVSTPQKEADINILLILLFAFIGGAILNIMPCVLPVLSIKLLGILRHHDEFDAKTVRLSFISAATGIITSFLALGLLVVVLKSVGVAVGWGFHFQQPYFIVAMVLILTFFACNLWGMFEINITSYLGNRLGLAASKEGLLGHFLTGVLATLLATPCTAPFLGTAVGFALSQNAIYISLVFFCMGLGMALPYFLLIYKPSWVKFLPKPGGWMAAVKYVMGVFLLLTAIWLVWVSAAQLGEYGARALGLVVALIIVNLIPSLWKSQNMRAFLIVMTILAALSLPSAFKSQESAVESEKAQENTSLWASFDQSSIQTYVSDGKIVLVDVTADWCITCKFNELWAFSDEEVQAALRADNMVAMRADWTNRDDEILRYLQSHQRQGIPFNVVYSQKHPEGIVLPELLSKTDILDAIKQAK